MSESSAIREFALAFPKAFEDHPFGPDTHVFKVGGKSMFVILSDGPPVKVTVKLTKEERQVALEMPYVSEAAVRRPVRLDHRLRSRTSTPSTPRSSGSARATG